MARTATNLLAASAVILLGLAGCSSSPDSSPSVDSPSATAATEIPVAKDVKVEVVGTVAKNLVSPWGIAFLPDGSAFVSERDTGKINLVNPKGPGNGPGRTVGTVPQTVASGESGLLGLAVPPGSDPKSLFAYVTTSSDNRVVEMSWNGTKLGDPHPILTGIPAGEIHDGGRLAFGPDSFLYVSTGEVGDDQLAQNLNSLGGKILRITAAGKVPPGNPFPGSPVWSYGHRNVQGLAFDSRNRLWATEFGWNKHDELNLIKPGSNYGWPIVEGKSNDGRFANPEVQWPTAEASPSGLAIISDHAFMAALRGERLWEINVVGKKARDPQQLFVRNYGRLRTPAVAPDGRLWLSTSNTDGRGDPRPGDDRILVLKVTAKALPITPR